MCSSLLPVGESVLYHGFMLVLTASFYSFSIFFGESLALCGMFAASVSVTLIDYMLYLIDWVSVWVRESVRETEEI